MSDRPTDTDLHSQASEEARASGERVNVALQEPCVHGLTDRHGTTTNKWDCWGCTREVVAAEVDRVSRERTRQALERAATVLDAKVKEHRDEQEECARESAAWEGHVTPPCPERGFCEDFGCTTLEQLASAIRGLSDGESVASEEKEE